MHQNTNLLRIFITKQIREYQKRHRITQKVMAGQLHILTCSYVFLERGICGCSAATLVFFFLIPSDEEVPRLRMKFRTLVQREDEYVVA